MSMKNEAGGDTGVSASFLTELRGGGGSGDESAPASATAKRSAMQQHLLVVLLIAVSAAMLYGMRRYGMNSGMKFEHADLTYKPDEGGGKPPNTELLLARLEGGAVAGGASRLGRDPFVLPSEVAATATVAENSTDRERAAALAAAQKAQAARLQEIEDEFAGFELRSIVKGRVPLARIGDRLYRVGDAVGTHFRVAAIRWPEVVLTADGHEYKLSMQAQADGDGPR